MKLLAASFFSACAVFLAAPPALAAADTMGDGGLAACKTDMDKLCPGMQPGEGRVKACFKEHKSELSKECKKELASARKRKAG